MKTVFGFVVAVFAMLLIIGGLNDGSLGTKPARASSSAYTGNASSLDAKVQRMKAELREIHRKSQSLTQELREIEIARYSGAKPQREIEQDVRRLHARSKLVLRRARDFIQRIGADSELRAWFAKSPERASALRDFNDVLAAIEARREKRD